MDEPAEARGEAAQRGDGERNHEQVEGRGAGGVDKGFGGVGAELAGERIGDEQGPRGEAGEPDGDFEEDAGFLGHGLAS